MRRPITQFFSFFSQSSQLPTQNTPSLANLMQLNSRTDNITTDPTIMGGIINPDIKQEGKNVSLKILRMLFGIYIRGKLQFKSFNSTIPFLFLH